MTFKGWGIGKGFADRARPILWVAVMGLASCGYFETGYFQDKVNQATMETVGKRYGGPHKVERLGNGGESWTYYDRGSATASYAGYARGKFCRAYILSFDQEGILRDWKQQDC